MLGAGGIVQQEKMLALAAMLAQALGGRDLLRGVEWAGDGAQASVGARADAYASFFKVDEKEKTPAQVSKLVRALEPSYMPPRQCGAR